MSRTTWLAAFILSSTSCAEVVVPNANTQSADSSGVRLVSSSQPTWGSAPIVASEPMLSIGSPDAGDGVFLQSVPSARRATTGRIVALDRGSMEVLVFSPDGELLTRVGGKGGGPGEFLNLWHVHLISDTIVAFDPQSARITRFDLEGALLDSQAIPTEDYPIWRYQLVGAVDSGWLLAGLVGLPGGCGTGSVCWDTLPSLIFTEGGQVREADSYEAAGALMFQSINASGGHPFGAHTVATQWSDGVVFGDGRDPEVRFYGRNDRLRAVARWQSNRRPIRDEDFESQVEATLAQLRERNLPTEAMARQFDGLEASGLMPAFKRILASPTGTIWLEPYTPGGEALGSVWTAIGSDGQWLGSVEMPGRTLVTDIGDDYVLGVWKDELDVQHIRMWQLSSHGRAT